MIKTGARVVSTWSPRIRGSVVGFGTIQPFSLNSEGYPQEEDGMELCYLVRLDVPVLPNFKDGIVGVRVIPLRADHVQEEE